MHLNGMFYFLVSYLATSLSPLRPSHHLQPNHHLNKCVNMVDSCLPRPKSPNFVVNYIPPSSDYTFLQIYSIFKSRVGSFQANCEIVGSAFAKKWSSLGTFLAQVLFKFYRNQPGPHPPQQGVLSDFILMALVTGAYEKDGSWRNHLGH